MKNLIFIFFLSSCAWLPAQNLFSGKRKIASSEWTQVYTFPSSKDALDYALARKISIQRFYQLKAEPYFGTPAAKVCTANVDLSGNQIPIKNGQYFFQKVVVNEFHALSDCIKEQNSLTAFYEFAICDNHTVKESRSYFTEDPIEQIQPGVSCDE